MVEIKDGAIQFVAGLPRGVILEIRDYDIQDEEGEDIRKGRDGRHYERTRVGNG